MSASIYAPSADNLRADPQLLLRNRNPFADLSVRDGKLATVIQDGSYFVTTPNADRILAPLWGATRAVYLRTDGLFGDDDPIQWPQLFEPKSCHFSAIPVRPKHNQPDSSQPARIMWHCPTRQDHICPASHRSILRGCGKLASPLVQQYGLAVESVRGKYNDFLLSVPSDQISPLLAPLIQNLAHAMGRLEMLPTSYMEMVLTVRALQRSLLEATAIMDYKHRYQPLMNGLMRRNASEGVEERLGAFTFDLRVVEDHVAAGLPVWFIQPSSAFTFQNILQLAPLTSPSQLIEMNLPHASDPPVFTGRNADKFFWIYRLVRRMHNVPDPFNEMSRLTSAATDSAVGPARQVGPSSKPSQALPYPNNRKQGNSIDVDDDGPAAGRSKFEPVDSPYMPNYIAAWLTALTSVDLKRPTRSRSRDDKKTLFPEIALFCTTTNPERQARYFAVWDYMKDALLHRVFESSISGASGSVEPLFSQDWRDLLNGNLFCLDTTKTPAGKERRRKKGTRTRERNRGLLHVLGPCLEHAGISMDFDHCPVKPALPSIQHARAQLWQISELSFRLEFFSLDRRVGPVQNQNSVQREQRSDLLHSCFPQGSSNWASLLNCDIACANQGLASTDWKTKLPYLLRFRQIMECWTGEVPRLVKTLLPEYSEQDTAKLELAVAKFYTQTFFEFFGRAPSIPMWLA
ncbi:hypothetical protein B0H10DRAFT_1979963 [Mycena sp. CBHHK59/15]|nr:hypothetical protein B0H10DRAFT_1979963 [Mycena sp. CBHHK59/15]